MVQRHGCDRDLGEGESTETGASVQATDETVVALHKESARNCSGGIGESRTGLDSFLGMPPRQRAPRRITGDAGTAEAVPGFQPGKTEHQVSEGELAPRDERWCSHTAATGILANGMNTQIGASVQGNGRNGCCSHKESGGIGESRTSLDSSLIASCTGTGPGTKRRRYEHAGVQETVCCSPQGERAELSRRDRGV